MNERIRVSQHPFLVAEVAAVLTFSALLWVGNKRERQLPSSEKQVTQAPQTMQTATTQANPASHPLIDPWIPSPAEFVRLTATVSVYNSRGKLVKPFPVGKRLRVSKRAGDKITINYLGDEYTIATKSTVPSK